MDSRILVFISLYIPVVSFLYFIFYELPNTWQMIKEQKQQMERAEKKIQKLNEIWGESYIQENFPDRMERCKWYREQLIKMGEYWDEEDEEEML